MEESGMKLSVTSWTALMVAALLASLSLVTWRQARSREALEELDTIRREVSLAKAERDELEHRIQILESRSRVVPEARERLGMRTPGSGEIVLLSGGDR
jgi:cell division protein FtsL